MCLSLLQTIIVLALLFKEVLPESACITRGLKVAGWKKFLFLVLYFVK